jgi:lipopolysaccharide cholinephosphotransferase
MQWQNNKGYSYYCGFGSHYSFKKQVQPKEWWAEGTSLPFEGKEYIVPKEYDKILTKLYGDYMTPLPENKRSNHDRSNFKII